MIKIDFSYKFKTLISFIKITKTLKILSNFKFKKLKHNLLYHIAILILLCIKNKTLYIHVREFMFKKIVYGPSNRARPPRIRPPSFNRHLQAAFGMRKVSATFRLVKSDHILLF